jgi:purine/pyrimidine-nucleoside phosphorylase
MGYGLQKASRTFSAYRQQMPCIDGSDEAPRLCSVAFSFFRSSFVLKHNTYFDGNVQSVGFERNGLRATVGVIAPGEYHFNTAAAERMSVTSGQLMVKLANSDWQSFPAGTYFEVPANSGFDVKAVGGAAAYLCEFLAT